MRTIPVALAASLLLIAGCGGGSPRDAVSSDWHAAAVAMADGDGKTACSHFTQAVSGTLSSSSGLSCADAVKDLAAPLTTSDRDGVKAAKATVVTLAGANATVAYPLTPGLRKLGFTGRSRLARVGGRWLIAPRTG
jgi:hypothetical protein